MNGQLFLRMGPENNINLSELDMLGRREFDHNNRWDLVAIP